MTSNAPSEAAPRSYSKADYHRFLKAFIDCGTHKQAAEVSGVPLNVVAAFRARDPDLARLYALAREARRMALEDYLYTEAIGTVHIDPINGRVRRVPNITELRRLIAIRELGDKGGPSKRLDALDKSFEPPSEDVAEAEAAARKSLADCVAMRADFARLAAEGHNMAEEIDAINQEIVSHEATIARARARATVAVPEVPSTHG